MRVCARNRPARGDHALVLAEQLEPRTLLAVVFGPTPQVATVPASYNHVVADFDGDGVQDMAMLGATSDKLVTLLRGRGDGTFDPPQTTTLNVRAWSLGAGDVLSGGGAELVVAGGTGIPVSPDPLHPGFRVTYVRIMAFNAVSGKLEVARTVTLSAPPDGDYRPSNPIIGEFTGGGAPDIVLVPDNAKGRLVVLEGFGGTLRLSRTITTPAPVGRFNHIPVDPVATDFDGDGRTDILTFTSAGYVALLNSAAGLSSTIHSVPLSDMFTWKFADVNGDGKADAISMWTPPDQIRSTSPNRYVVVRVKLGVGDGTFGALQTISRVRTGSALGPGTYPPREYEDILVGGDLDGDGLGDVVFVRDSRIEDRSGQGVSERTIGLTHAPGGGWNVPSNLLAPNDASGNLNQTLDVLIGSGSTFLADMNGDGRADLIDPSYSRVQVFRAVNI